MEKQCLYCGKPIEMSDYRVYTIIQHEDETCVTVYLHLVCIERDSEHWLIRTLETYERLKEVPDTTKGVPDERKGSTTGG